MKNLWKGIEYLTPSQALKDQTKQRILEGKVKPAASKIRPIQQVIAACVALALVGGSVFAVYHSGGLSSGLDGGMYQNNGTADTAPNINGDNAFTDNIKPETGVDMTVGENNDIDASEKPSAPSNDGLKGETEKDMPTAGESTPTGGTAGEAGSVKPEAGLLTAKRWDDHLHFDEWISLLGQDSAFRQYQQNWGLNLTKRITVTVKSGQTLLPGVKVILRNAQGDVIWTAVSDNKGKAYLFYNAFGQADVPAVIAASYGGNTAEKQLEDSAAADYTINFDGQSKGKTALDLMFVCDTTGSMGDELSYLQAELMDIIQRVKKQNGNIPLRLSVNFYRDEGEEYVVRSFPFTEDFDRAVQNLGQQTAEGGGDYEEAVEEALSDAIHGHEWSDAESAKLLFLVLDAPPHAAAKDQMQQLLLDAAERGIRVIPVIASGADQNTEFLMRSFALGTGGSYVTLTNDSGIGDGHLEPSVGETEVYKLNDLLLEIINDYLQ